MIPTAALRQQVTIEPYEGTTGTGEPRFGDPIQVPARVVGRRRAVRTREGVDVIADATADIRPGDPIPAESLVTRADGRTYTVLAVIDTETLSRSHHRQLVLEGPKGGT